MINPSIMVPLHTAWAPGNAYKTFKCLPHTKNPSEESYQSQLFAKKKKKMRVLACKV